MYCAPGESLHVAALFNEKKIYRQVVLPLGEEALREAVMDACGEHAMRVEQERMGQELERNLQRERALRAGPVALPVEAGPGFQSARCRPRNRSGPAWIGPSFISTPSATMLRCPCGGRRSIRAVHSTRTQAYLSSKLFTADVVAGLKPLLKAEPEVRVYVAP